MYVRILLFMGIGGDDCFVFITLWKAPNPILTWAFLLDGSDTIENFQVSFSPYLTQNEDLRNCEIGVKKKTKNIWLPH